MPPSFIDSPFATRVEYNAWLAAGAPEDALKAALEAKVQPAVVEDEAKAEEFEPLDFPE